jgi:CRISPR/Cas system-associated exonuclease Cas4 (RecB family)
MAALVTMPAPVEHQLAEVLSPSQVGQFQQCSAKWYFRYALGIKEPKTSNLALGIAVHDPIAANFRLKMETGKDLPMEDVLAEFDAAWAGIEAETAFRDDEDPLKLALTGRGLVELYMREMAPRIQPIAVELPVSGVIGGVKVQGIIDLIDQHCKIRETKTSGRTSRTLSAGHKFQLTTYAMLTPKPCSGIQRDELVKTKTPKLVSIADTVKDADVQHVETMFPLLQDSMRSGYYFPARDSYLCSRKHCGYWRLCQEQYGGTVGGGADE